MRLASLSALLMLSVPGGCVPGFLTPKKHLQEDFVLGSEETLLRTVGLERSLEASGRCIIPVTYPSPRVSLKFPARAHAPRGAFSFFVPSPLRSYLGRCPGAFCAWGWSLDAWCLHPCRAQLD